MNQVIFVTQLIFFIFSSFILFTTVGGAFLEKSKAKLSFWEKIILGTIFGWIVFTLLGYIFLVLNLKFLMIPIYIIILFLALRIFKFSQQKVTLLPKKLLAFFVPIFTVGIIMQLLVISPSGLEINGNVLFWSSHAHDGSWHIALMNQMEKGWPIQNPAFAGERLVNYHFFSDITPMYFNYFFKISFLDLYFRFFPLFYAVIFASLAYLIGKRITASFWGGFWSFIFADFAGSFGFIVTFLRDRKIDGEALFWSSQPQSTIGNPPQISASILILCFFILFSIYLEKRSELSPRSKDRSFEFLSCDNKNIFLFLCLIGGTLITFKVYAGIALLGSVAVCALWQIIKEKRAEFLLLFIVSAITSAILFLPNTAKSASMLILEPWWYIRTLVVVPDRLGLIDWEHRRQTYVAEHNWKRVIQLELNAFLIFFFGNLGMRFLGLIVLLKYLKTFFSSYFNQLLLSMALGSFLFPMIFVQKGETSGTSQFFQYYLIVLGIFAAEAILYLGQKIKPLLPKVILGVLIIILAVPTQIGLLVNFYQRNAFAKIDSNEQQALSFIKNNTPQNAVILTPLFDRYVKLDSLALPVSGIDAHTPPIWGWSDSVYVGAFAERSVYLADEEQVKNTGYDYQNRKSLARKLFDTDNLVVFNQLIKETKANYLYFPIIQKPKINLHKTSLKPVFTNDIVEIWKIN